MEYLNKNLFKLISGGILSLSLLLFPSMGYSYSSVDKSVGGAESVYTQNTTHARIVKRAVELVCENGGYPDLCNELNAYFGTPTSTVGLYLGSNYEDVFSIGADKMSASLVPYLDFISLERNLNHGYNPKKTGNDSAWPTPPRLLNKLKSTALNLWKCRLPSTILPILWLRVKRFRILSKLFGI